VAWSQWAAPRDGQGEETPRHVVLPVDVHVLRPHERELVMLEPKLVRQGDAYRLGAPKSGIRQWKSWLQRACHAFAP